MAIPPTGRLDYWRTPPISGSSGMMRKTIAACENAGSVLPISCRRSSIRTDGWSVTVGETMAKNFRLYGRGAGRLFVIAYTRRETATRIISARKANATERDRYGAD